MGGSNLVQVSKN